MSWNCVLTTTDVDAFLAAIRPTTEALTVSGRGPFSASLTRIELHNLRMQRFSENLSRAWELQVPPTRTAVAFAIEQKHGIRWRGADIAANEVIPLRASVYGWRVLTGEVRWGSMSLLSECLTETSIALIGRDVTPSHDAVALAATTIIPEALHQLSELLAARDLPVVGGLIGDF